MGALDNTEVVWVANVDASHLSPCREVTRGILIQIHPREAAYPTLSFTRDFNEDARPTELGFFF